MRDKAENNRDEFILFRFLVISGIEFLGAAAIYLYVYMINSIV